MTPVSLLLALAISHDAPPPPADEPEEEYVDEELVKKGIPQPPAGMDAKAYAAWKKGLPAKIQRKIRAHCTEHGGDYQEVCNGIGPLGIPSPPALDLMGDDPDAERAEWLRALTAPQRHYVREYCGGGENDMRGYSQLCGGTPIVIAFGSDAVKFTAGTHTDWPTIETPWLARDIDGDGAISTDELFGSATKLPDGSRAKHGFEALAALDGNRDGVLDERDPAFASLLVWADRDGNRESSPGELSPAGTLVKSMSLAIDKIERCDARGNCEGERAPMQWRDETGATRTGELIDVYLKYR